MSAPGQTSDSCSTNCDSIFNGQGIFCLGTFTSKLNCAFPKTLDGPLFLNHMVPSFSFHKYINMSLSPVICFEKPMSTNLSCFLHSAVNTRLHISFFILHTFEGALNYVCVSFRGALIQ